MDWLGLIDHLHTPLLVLMVVVFCAIVAWAYAPKSRTRMEERARIPLDDDRQEPVS